MPSRQSAAIMRTVDRIFNVKNETRFLNSGLFGGLLHVEESSIWAYMLEGSHLCESSVSADQHDSTIANRAEDKGKKERIEGYNVIVASDLSRSALASLQQCSRMHSDLVVWVLRSDLSQEHRL